MPRKLIIATRESPLALWQAEFVRAALLQAHPDLDVQLLGMTSRGDQLLDVPLAKVGGKGLFVKELEEALLDGSADIAVHSMKDVPMEFPAGLGLGVICAREDPSDAFVSNRYRSLDALPAGSVVGTSSLRRECQLRARRPDLDIKFLRGNVNTRLRKLDADEYDAIILASAGLLRLGLAERIAQRMDVGDSLPAGGQGAVGIELRSADAAVRAAAAAAARRTDRPTRDCRAGHEPASGGRLPGAHRLLCGICRWRRAIVVARPGGQTGRFADFACASDGASGRGRATRHSGGGGSLVAGRGRHSGRGLQWLSAPHG